MNRYLLISFICLVAMILVMRYQGEMLITPVSPLGILDLEFARNGDRLTQLRLFWNLQDVRMNIYLDFLFIAAYTWFLYGACSWISKRNQWYQHNHVFIGMSVAAGLFDVCENLLMLMILNARFDPWVLQIVYYCALVKFILIALVILYLVISLIMWAIKRIGN